MILFLGAVDKNYSLYVPYKALAGVNIGPMVQPLNN